MSFFEEFENAETKGATSAKVTEVPEGDHQYIVKGFNVSDEKGAGIHLEFPKYRTKEWANYGPKVAWMVRKFLETTGALVKKADGKPDIQASLKNFVGYTGTVSKTFTEARNGGKPFANYTFKDGVKGDQVSNQRADDINDDIPF